MKTTGIPWLRISAESIAIVGSILLAFAIDAWYETVSEQRLEADYLQRIADELAANQSLLDYHLEGINRSVRNGEYVSRFFEGLTDSLDYDELLAHLYYMGLDSSEPFEFGTYDDLVSTGRLGLISNVEIRTSIQSAYRALQRAQETLSPYRDEYLSGIRARIPISVIDQLRDACPGRPGFDCERVTFDPEVANSILEHLSTDRALVAFRLREQGLSAATGILTQVQMAVNGALDLLE